MANAPDTEVGCRAGKKNWKNVCMYVCVYTVQQHVMYCPHNIVRVITYAFIRHLSL